VQAHTSGEVGILGTVLLRVYSRTTFAVFIEIGLYLTDKKQKIIWHSFFETRCRCVAMPSLMAAHWVSQNSSLFFAIYGSKYTKLSLPVRGCLWFATPFSD